MAWVRIEDTVNGHPKHLKAGAAASWLWLCGIAYCQRQLSDGFIPVEAIPLLGVPRGFSPLVERLVEVRLFDRVDGGYRVHDYHDFNDTREEAKARHTERHESKVRAGRAGGLVKASRQLAGCYTPAIAGHQSSAVAKSSPIPSPPLEENPPTPLSAKGGTRRYLRGDLKEAQRIRKLRFGRCEHDPPCVGAVECETLMAIEIADRRKAAAS